MYSLHKNVEGNSDSIGVYFRAVYEDEEQKHTSFINGLYSY